MKKRGLIAVILMMSSIGAFAEVTLPKILGSGMVLQREKPVPIWGYAADGEVVTVKFANQTKTATTNANGEWKVILDAMPASAKGTELTVSGTNTIILKDI